MISARCKPLRHPGLTQAGGEVEQFLESWIRSNSPRDLAGLLDPISTDLLCDSFVRVGGCEGTVWIADSEESHLVAVYNSGADAESMLGFEQPIGSGIISMVYAQQQPYCENDILASAGHDDTLDRKIAKHTRAMIVVPFYFAFALRGVISCVQLEESDRNEHGFTSADVQQLSRVANVVERLINENLLSSILGLADVA
jgi:transcriptional regulator with GAF, ATPase, and Fis domain